MKKKHKVQKIEGSFLFIIVIMNVVVAVLIFGVVYLLAYNAMINDLKHRADTVHEYAARNLSIESFTDLNTKEDMASNVYKNTLTTLNDIRTLADIRYLYTAKVTDGGEYIYVVDGYEPDESDFRKVGDPIEPEIQEQLAAAMLGTPQYANSLQHTEWGDVYVVYYPEYDKSWNVIGALGMEFNVDDTFEAYQNILYISLLTAAALTIISIVVSSILLRRVSNPLMRELAYSDYLTGLKNRNSFEIDMRALQRSLSSDDLIIITVFDMDNLKETNDTFGHKAGDHYLKQLGENLEEYLGEIGAVYRTGGDEFTHIAKGQSKMAIETAIEKMKENIESENKTAQMPLKFAYGIRQYDPESDQNMNDVYVKADEAMYEMKRTAKKKRAGKE